MRVNKILCDRMSINSMSYLMNKRENPDHDRHKRESMLRRCTANQVKIKDEGKPLEVLVKGYPYYA